MTTGLPARMASLAAPAVLAKTMSSRLAPLIAWARTARSVWMSQMTAFRMPFIWAVWQMAPVIIRPAPTQPTLIGLPAAWRRRSFC